MIPFNHMAKLYQRAVRQMDAHPNPPIDLSQILHWLEGARIAHGEHPDSFLVITDPDFNGVALGLVDLQKARAYSLASEVQEAARYAQSGLQTLRRFAPSEADQVYSQILGTV